MRTGAVYKTAFNRAAGMLRDGQLVGKLPSENELGRRMGVSRTTVRKVLRELAHRDLIAGRSGDGTAGRGPRLLSGRRNHAARQACRIAGYGEDAARRYQTWRQHQ